MDLLYSPLIIGSILAYIIVVYSSEELIMKLALSVIYIVYILSYRKRKIWILCLLLAIISPPFIILLAIFPILLVMVIMRYRNAYNRWLKRIYGLNFARIYFKYLFIVMGYFLFFTVFLSMLSPLVSSNYTGNYDKYINIGLIGYLCAIISVSVLFLLVFLSIDLVRITLQIHKGNDGLLKVILSFVSVILVFMLLPDFLFATIYSFSLNIIFNSSYEIIDMFYYSFILHYLIPMNSHYLSIQSVIQQNYMLGLLNGIHTIMIKVIDNIVITSIVLALFTNNLLKRVDEPN